MALTHVKVAAVWLAIYTVFIYVVSGQETCNESSAPSPCTFNGTTDPTENELYITILEEEQTDKRDPLNTTDVIYSIPCKNCNISYVGETGRKFGKRLDEHRAEADKASVNVRTRANRKASESTINKSAITDHVLERDHIIDWDEARVLGKETDRYTRWIKEAVAIRKQGTTMNRDEGQYNLSHVFDDLLKKNTSGNRLLSNQHPLRVVDLNDIIIYQDKLLPIIRCDPPPGSGRAKNCINARIQFQNLNEPAVLDPVYKAEVFEHSPLGTTVRFDIPIVAEDPDVILEGLDYGNFACELVEPNIPFSVSCTTINDHNTLKHAAAEATITVAGLLDYETGPKSYDITLKVTDTTDSVVNSPIAVNTVLHIEVVDLDDLSPAFDYAAYSSSIEEQYKGLLPVSPDTVRAIDQDVDIDESIIYSLADETYLTIDETTGVITVITPFDRNVVGDTYTVIVKAEQVNNAARSATVLLTVTITDLNDNCPSFDSASYQGQVAQDDFYVAETSGDRLVIFARDDDDIFEGVTSIEQDGSIFGLEEVTAVPEYLELYVRLLEPQNLNSDGTPHILKLYVNSTNAGTCSDSTIVNVIVLSSRNPLFDEDSYAESVSENASPGIILVVSAKNSAGTDVGIVYRIKSATNDGFSQFAIDEQSGAISLTGTVDYETYKDYTLVVEAQDRRSDPTRSTSTSVTINVIDMNDSCPEFVTPPLVYYGQVSSQDAYVVDDQSVRLMLTASDPDQTFYAETSVTDVTGAGFDVEYVSLYGNNIYLVTIQDFSALTIGWSYTIQVSIADSNQPLCPSSDVNVNITAADLSPNFDQKEYSASIDEGSAVGTPVVTVSAATFDGTQDIVYSIRSSSDNGINKFQIDETSGEITVKDDTINAEDVALYTLVVEAQDRRLDPIRSATATVFVEILDVNDECPEFVNSAFTGVISSHDVYVVTSSSQRLVLSATDKDIGMFIGTTAVTDNSGAGFTVETAPSSAGSTRDYYIKVGDFSKLVPDMTYTIQVSLTDPSQPICTSVANVDITATNLSPVFDQEEYTASVEEGSAFDTPVVTVSAETYDITQDIVYSIRSSSDSGINKFEINETSGEITVKDDTINAEDVALYTLVVEAQDRRQDPIRSATATVFVEILDVNDECPEFLNTAFTGVISSHDVYVTSNSHRLVLSAIDKDIGLFFGSTAVTDNSGAGFTVETAPSSAGSTRDYYIKVGDFSKLVPDMIYTIEVSLTDSTQPLCTSVANVNINATNLSPTFDQEEYTASVEEGCPVDTPVVTVSAETYDNTQDIVYSIRSSSDGGIDKFQIDEISGEITVKDDTINAEDVALYTLVVEAQDRRLDPIRSATTTVFVEILDVNDECPEFLNTAFTGVISSHDVYVVTSNSQRLVLSATDKDIGLFFGTTAVTDNSGAGFTVETAPSSAGSTRDYYIKVGDFSKLVPDMTYTIEVSLTDPSQPLCTSVANVDITATNLSPVFDQEEYTASVEEGSAVDTPVVTVSAETYDNTQDIVYSIRSSSDGGIDKFEINETSGEITVKDDTINAEDVALYTLVVEAQDRRLDPIRSATATVFVEILDVNDECPEFVNSAFTGVISSHDVYVVTSSSQRLVLSATDKDIGMFFGSTAVTDNSGAGFTVETAPSSAGSTRDYYIKVGDFSKLVPDMTYTIEVSLTDPSQPICTSVANVDITATNLSPVFDQEEYTASVEEGSAVDTPVVTVSAETYDNTQDIVYSIRSSSDGGIDKFQINETSGEITVKDDTINAEDVALYTLVVQAQDRRLDPIRSATATVFVEILDVNDECPEFVNTAFTGVISSHDVYVTSNSQRLVLSATDKDIGMFIGTTTVTDNSGAGFTVETAPSSAGSTRDYYIKVGDFSKLVPDMTYTIQVSLTDSTQPLCTSIANVNINATNLSPTFDQEEYTASVDEGSAVDTSVVTVSAETYDNTQDIVYSIRSSSDGGIDKFEINEISGEITVKDDTINAEDVALYTLVVEAQDRRLDPIRSTTATVFVEILDVNDECPEFVISSFTGVISSHDVYVVTSSSQRLVLSATDKDIGMFIGTTTVTDNSGAGFTVETAPSSGGNTRDYYIKVGDFSKLVPDMTYTIQVSLTDPSQPLCTSVANVDITATNLSPVFDQEEYTASVEEGSAVDTPVVTVSAETYDNTQDIVYSIRSSSDGGIDKFQIDEISGEITVKDDTINAEDVALYTLVVEAQDRRLDPIRSATATVFVEILDVNDECPEFVNTAFTGLISSHDVYVVTSTSQRLVLSATDKDIGLFIGSTAVTDNSGAGFTVETAPSSAGSTRDYYIKVGDFSKLVPDMTYNIQVSLTDSTQPLCTTSVANVNINATNLSPTFDQEEYSASVEEGSAVDTPVVTVSAETYDNTQDIVYSIRSSSDGGIDKFEINEISGEITVKDDTINAEDVALYTLVVEAQDRRLDPIRSTTATVFVEILDVNDECPEFVNSAFTGVISSHDVYVTSSSQRLVLSATDKDISGFIGSTAVTDNSGAGFTVETAPSSGGNTRDYYIKVGDFSKLVPDMTYTIQVSLTDPSQPICTSVANVDITATNLSPVFDQEEYTALVEEGSAVDTPVVTVSAETYDNTQDIVYSIRSSSDGGIDKFQINEASGEITVKDDTINAEDVASYTLVVEAQDRRQDPIRSATATVFVEILDVNDECPEFVNTAFTGVISSHDVYVTSSSQRLVLSAIDKDIGQFIGITDVIDDSGAGFSVEIAPSSAGSTKDYYIKVGDFSKLVPDMTYTIQVLLSDITQPICTSSASVANVNITATNLSPMFDQEEYTASVEEGSPVDTPVVTVSAETFDNTQDIVYSIRSSSDDGINKFQIDETSGEITVKDDTLNAEDVALYTLVVEAQDRRLDPIRSSTVSVFVIVTDANDNCPMFEKAIYYGNITRQDVYVVDENLEQLMVVAQDPDSVSYTMLIQCLNPLCN
ncbi:cadherin-23-like [Amphiura filiformis]|uniref:cadherin-23-like n=1 Tax=Amphiura filiformis TaxID=82378 RepID=UPI003B20D40D